MPRMNTAVPNALAVIAGKGAYPLLLAEAAKRQGVTRMFAIAFRGETDRRIARLADEVRWIYLGQLGSMLAALRDSGITDAVMAGQITPTHLFRIRLDGCMLKLLRSLQTRNAETIFGAVARELRDLGIRLLPASSFMQDHMPSPGVLTTRDPTERERLDMELGIKVARQTSGLDVGQTVVVKEGTILAIEAFEGTDAAIRRAGKLGRRGAVVVKLAKSGHDMRFDIPVVGLHTVKTLRRAGASALAVEAGRAIMLERERVLAECNRLAVTVVAFAPGTDDIAPPGTEEANS